MSSSVSHDDVLHLARLARLELGEEELSRFAGQLSTVIGYIEQLQEVDTEGMDITKGITGLENVLMADEYRAKDDAAVVDRDAALRAAPLREGDLIQVRAVMSAGDTESA